MDLWYVKCLRRSRDPKNYFFCCHSAWMSAGNLHTSPLPARRECREWLGAALANVNFRSRARIYKTVARKLTEGWRALLRSTKLPSMAFALTIVGFMTQSPADLFIFFRLLFAQLTWECSDAIICWAAEPRAACSDGWSGADSSSAPSLGRSLGVSPGREQSNWVLVFCLLIWSDLVNWSQPRCRGAIKTGEKSPKHHNWSRNEGERFMEAMIPN